MRRVLSFRILCAWIALLALPPFLSACGGGGGGGGGASQAAAIAGRLVWADALGRRAKAQEALPVRAEEEPNDTLGALTRLGRLAPGEGLRVRGEAGAADDPFDAFELVVAPRARLTVTLAWPAEAGPALDVGVFELAGLSFSETHALDRPGDAAGFLARGVTAFVVRAARGAGPYELEVRAEAPPEPLAPPAGAGPLRLGTLVPGEALHLRTEGRVELVADVGAPARLVVEGPEAWARVCLADEPLRVELRAAGAYRVWIEPLDLARRALVPTYAAPDEAGAFRRALGPAEAFARLEQGLAAGRALVAPAPGADRAALRRAASARGLTILEDVPDGHLLLGWDESFAPEGAALRTLAQALRLRDLPGVAGADPSWRRRRLTTTPDDPRYDEQWHYDLIRLPEAWDLTTGSADVIVAVLDTGQTQHPDLAGRQIAGYDFISDRTIAGDGDGRDSDPTDVGDGEGGEPSSFHGTHVAGTLGAASDNGVGVAGVTWQTSLMHLRVLGIGGGEDADIVNAIRYAARLTNASGTLPPARAHVINMSLGGGGFNQAMQDAILAARDAGVVVFAAAGNSGTTAKEYPAAFDGVVSVAAVTRSKARAAYSNRGSTIDLAAPGGDTGTRALDGVLSTLYDDARGTPVATYDFYDGTSMATPHAAGVAALVLAADPTLAPAEVEAILFETAEDLGAAGRDDAFGHGLVDAYAAVSRAQEGTAGGPRLVLEPATLELGAARPSADATIRNAGTGRLEVLGLEPDTNDGGAWLSARRVGAGDATRSADAVRVEVDLARLGPDSATGRVLVRSTGGDRAIAVRLLSAAPPPGGGLDVWVLLVDARTEETVAEVRVAAGAPGDFSFEDVVPGRYRLYAGSDQDDDGWICDEGDVCGVYEEDGVEAEIRLAPGERLTGLTIVLHAAPEGFASGRRARRAGSP